MAPSPAAAPPAQRHPSRQPLIPPDVISHPTQRIYLLSLLVVAQAWKFSSTKNLFVWLAVDALLLGVLLPSLRVSRLSWGLRGALVAVAVFWTLDWIVLGNWAFVDILNALPGVTALKGERLSVLAFLSLPKSVPDARSLQPPALYRHFANFTLLAVVLCLGRFSDIYVSVFKHYLNRSRYPSRGCAYPTLSTRQLTSWDDTPSTSFRMRKSSPRQSSTIYIRVES
jgi:hypothetical protein